MQEKQKTLHTTVLLIAFAIIGIFFRIKFFSYLRPFWNDECALALNIANKSFLGLFSSLDYQQATPVLFLVVAKLSFLMIKSAEVALRLPSLICSILSIGVFYVFSKKVLKSKISITFAMILFTLNYQLIYFSQEFKQYSSDVLIFLLILTSYFFVDFDNPKKPKTILANILYASSIWFSHTAIIALASVFILKIKDSKKNILYVFSATLISLCTYIFYNASLNSNQYLHLFWQKGFISHNFSNIGSIVSDNLIYYFTDFPNKIIIIILFTLGIFCLVKNIKQNENKILLTPLLLAITLSFCSIYPMYLRTMLYLMPVIFIIIAKPIDCIKIKNEFLKYIILGFIFAHFIICTAKTDLREIIHKNYYRESTLELLKNFSQLSGQNDILVIPYLSSINFEFYKSRIGIKNREILVIKRAMYEENEIAQMLELLPPNHAYYILFTHSGDKPYEYKNLCIAAKKLYKTEIYSDKYYNALIKIQK